MNIRQLLIYKPFLIVLFIINFLGTIYGYYWYKSQLEITPTHFLPFVPDSPTASLFFSLFLLLFIFNRYNSYIEAFAVTNLIKYGIWAVVMNVITLIVEGSLSWQGYMLIMSHGLMAVQAFLYTPYYKFELKHLTVAGIFLLHNEITDYVFGMMPIYSSLSEYLPQIGYFTFWLSVATLIVTYQIMVKQK